MSDTTGVFTFQGHRFQKDTGEAYFSYELKHGDEVFRFTEKLTFPSIFDTQVIPEELLSRVLDSLLLVLGISYWKLFCPKKIDLLSIFLSKEQAEFWNTVYTKGLGEFFYKNKIDYRNFIKFPFVEKETPVNIAFPRRKRSLVGIGGGKDSIVTGELLKKAGKECAAFVVNSHTIQQEVIQLLGIDSIRIKRQLDLLLFQLNKRQDTYNGHVPLSAQYAWIGLLTAILYDYAYVFVSNEQSANYANTSYLGQEVNHQWSKSFEFERMLQQYVATYITNDIAYFSLLRPYSELKITEFFSQYRQYFPIFSSCNSNFRITPGEKDSKWCGECPKCVFVFVMLAGFLPKEEVVGIFGQNLFTKESLVAIYRQLLGLADIKPWECVGTPEEVRVALWRAYKTNAYAGEPIMELFKAEILSHISDFAALEQKLFTPSDEHAIPKEFISLIHVAQPSFL